MASIAEARQAPSRPKAKVVRHRVQRGETIIQIAKRYGTSAESILKINRIRRANLLRAGSTVIIPKL
jgi:nucleoid-associated protein YgaU